MRAQARQVSHEAEEESAFVSMTDMTVGFLFIIMILLAFFASQIRDTDSVPRVERDYWQNLAESRATKIDRLEKEVLEISKRRDALELERNRLLLELETARTALKEAVEEAGRLKERIAELESILAELRREVEQRNQEIANLKTQIERLKRSGPLERYLTQVAAARREVLVRLRDAILQDFPDLQVELSEESDALRFQGEGLFASGQSNLANDKRNIVASLAQRLDEVLPCFTVGQRSQFSDSCNPGYVMIEAVQIEGHTDNRGGDSLNRILSAARANSTFFAMTASAPLVTKHNNLKGQPVLSVAAYGPDRPVASNETPDGRATNRRIDLRFIMVTPRDTDGIVAVRAALDMFSSEAQ